ncbi:phage major capsid protein [Gordonia alkanivorans]|uniref:phage major capsid protein n=1 Tax=Gordonia alkanivorans TaxID=84096 RepID=UPI0024494704|nr:phage major capsid protein [Gordonia alkanivorans]MDJ0099911.1 phage major capsid protein [Gordonia alkanivorans]
MATETTTTSAQAWSPDVIAFPPADAVPDALIVQAATNAGVVEGDAPSVRVPYVDDAEAQVTAEGAPIPEADPELNEVTAHTAKVTQLIRVSREQFVQPNAADQLAQSARRAVTRKADQLFVAAAAPVAPAVAPVAGLINQAGITEAAAPVGGSLDGLVDLVAVLESNGATPTLIVVDPIAWAELQKLKTATESNQSLIGAGTTAAQKMLLSLPVLVNSAVPTASGLVIDKTQVIAALGPVNVATSDQAYFASDSVGVRVTFRFGFALPRPERIGAFEVVAA